MFNCDGADVENSAFRRELDHPLQHFRGVGHCPLESAVCAEDKIDEVGLLVQAGLETRHHILQEVRGAERLPFGLVMASASVRQRAGDVFMRATGPMSEI